MKTNNDQEQMIREEFESLNSHIPKYRLERIHNGYFDVEIHHRYLMYKAGRMKSMEEIEKLKREYTLIMKSFCEKNDLKFQEKEQEIEDVIENCKKVCSKTTSLRNKLQEKEQDIERLSRECSGMGRLLESGVVITHAEYTEFISLKSSLQEKEQEIEKLKEELNNSKHFHCPSFKTTDNGYVACNKIIEAKRLEALECLEVIDHCINLGIKDIQYNGNPMIFHIKTIKAFLESLGEGK